MPHTTGAKKRLRQTAKRNARNRSAKKAIKTQIKRFGETASAGTLAELQVEYNAAAKKLDRAAARKIIHRNLAARKKAQLSEVLRKKGQQTANAGASPT